jgi:endonuclease YncB( thermonuclease family)
MRVIEADTLEIWVNGARIGVGIIGIKAPAGNTACGREAIDVVTQLVGSGIWLDEDLALPAFDRRYRRLYRLTTAGGLPVAAELAMAGLVESEPADKQSQDYPAIAAAEVQAKSAGRGCRWSGEPVRGR